MVLVIFVILAFEKSIDVYCQPNMPLLTYSDSLLIYVKKRLGTCKSAFRKSKTTCFTFQSGMFPIPKYATCEGKTSCFTLSSHVRRRRVGGRREFHQRSSEQRGGNGRNVDPLDDGRALIVELDGEPEMETLGQTAGIPDVGHEHPLVAQREDISALCAEGLVGRHVLIARGCAYEGRGQLLPGSPDAARVEHAGFVGCPACASGADEPVVLAALEDAGRLILSAGSNHVVASSEVEVVVGELADEQGEVLL